MQEPLSIDWFEVGLTDSLRYEDARSEYDVDEGEYGSYLDGYNAGIWHPID